MYNFYSSFSYKHNILKNVLLKLFYRHEILGRLKIFTTKTFQKLCFLQTLEHFIYAWVKEYSLKRLIELLIITILWWRHNSIKKY